MRAYYFAGLEKFRHTNTSEIVNGLTYLSGSDVTIEQKDAWKMEVDLLKRETRGLDHAHAFLEFTIPRMGKRADALLVFSGVVFVVEFKIGQTEYVPSDVEQCVDYALDLKNFHEGSHEIPVVPILVATGAPEYANGYDTYEDGFIKPVLVNERGLGNAILEIVRRHGGKQIDVNGWVNSRYKPTPTIIEAAVALYERHSVADITRSESGAENLTKTTDTVEQIIDRSKKLGRKSICFVTGVPGAGKTLAGLNLTSRRQDSAEGEHAIFLSGNGPLIQVLQEALVQNRMKNNQLERVANPNEPRLTKKEALRTTKVLIQSVGNFLVESIEDTTAPHEKILVFDEAQRAWDSKAMDRFHKKKHAEITGTSQPESLINVMDRHSDWAVLVCLVGGGQEINHNEAGLPEWFSAIRRCHTEWDVYLSGEITDDEYVQGSSVEKLLCGLRVDYHPDLHLATSIRSTRGAIISEFVKAILDLDEDAARAALGGLNKYPIVLTRDFARAKEWLKEHAHGSTRYGIVAAAKSYRLKPHGIYVELAVDAAHWFLKPPNDPRSSCSLEYAATEFKIQGLELDWACVAWDGDLRHVGGSWKYKEFRGDKWTEIRNADKRKYLKNAYRVLLTRARQGMVIFVPYGNEYDATRSPEFYDGTYKYLKSMGFEEL